jgi:hypothetical protein
VLVGVFTLEVGFTGVNVPFVIVVGVYVNSIFGHGVTSSAGIFLGGKTWLSLVSIYGLQRKRQCESVGCGMVVGCYQKRKEGEGPVFLRRQVWTGGLSPRPIKGACHGKKTLAAIPKGSTRERTSLNGWDIGKVSIFL